MSRPLDGGPSFCPLSLGERARVRASKTTPPLYLPIINLVPLHTNPILPPLVLREYYGKTQFQRNIEANYTAIIPASIAAILTASIEKPHTQFSAPGLRNQISENRRHQTPAGKMPSPIPAAHQTPFSPKSIERCLRTLINIRHPPHPPPNSPLLRVLTSELSNLRRSTLPIIKRALL